jgi:hypothetical protein
VGKLSLISVTFEDKKELTLERNRMDANNVGKHSYGPVPLKSMTELNLERKPMDINNFQRPEETRMNPLQRK